MAESQPSPRASQPAVPVIRKLDEAVVNKIAAGEVIQRPASAVKELLENSLDAGSTQINITVKEGGIKLLQITDNGQGIRKADLPILCHRHTTSKLQEFEDLETIGTLGFRGEALCSISFVSNMTITTMTPDALHGWRVSFKDSEMVPPGPKPVASVQGTTISVEDLFYNVPTRRKALKSATEEYARVVDVVSRYAVYSTGVGFTCRREGESRADVSTLPSASRLGNIRSVYGTGVAKDLLPITIKVGGDVTADLGVESDCTFSLNGYVSSANYSAKASTFILFINGRSVECGPLKRALEATYASVLPKGSRPWMFFDLTLPTRHVEVNMHPTKREVGLLNQEVLVESIRSGVEALLLAANTTRTFTQQELPFVPATIQITPSQSGVLADPLRELPNGTSPLDTRTSSGAVHPGAGRLGSTGTGSAPGSTGGGAVPYRPQKLVRVDSRAQTLDGFLASQYATPRAAALAGSVRRKRGAPGDGRVPPPELTADPLAVDLVDSDDEQQQEGNQAGGATQGGSRPGRQQGAGPPLGVVSQLDSIRQLAWEVEAEVHPGLTELMRGHTFVGMADDTLALLQHQTKLYLVNVHHLSYDFFYQQVLRRWEGCGRIHLDPAPSLAHLMALAMQLEQHTGGWQGSVQKVCDLTVQLMCEKSAMLSEYVGMQVDDQGRLVSLPELLPGFTPDLGYLPDLLLALGREVDWEEELPCFRGLAQVLARFYSVQPCLQPVFSTATAAKIAARQASLAAEAATAGVAGGTQGHATQLQPDVVLDMDEEEEGEGEEGGRGNGKAGAGGVGPGQQSGQATSEVLYPATAGTAGGAGGEQGTGSAGGHQPGDAAGQGQVVSGGDGSTPGAVQMVVDTQVEGLVQQPEAEAAGGSEGVGGAQMQWEGPPGAASSASEVTEEETAARAWMMKQVLFPAMKSQLRPSKFRASDGTFVLVTSLEKLYRIFERC